MHPPRKASRGLALIEVLVVVSVLALLLSLALPLLSRSRRTARSVRCLSNQRENLRLMTVYSASHQDLAPCFVSARGDLDSNPSAFAHYRGQVFSLLGSRPWLDFCGLSDSSTLRMCPGNPYLRSGPPSIGASDYLVSPSLLVRPDYLDPSSPKSSWSETAGAEVQRFSSASFPSGKAMVFEHIVWHGALSVPPNVNGLLYWQSEYPGSIGFMDGHANPVKARDAVSAVNRAPWWPRMPFGTTPWGIRGRDR